MKLPRELELAARIRRQRRVVREVRTCKPITGNYCKAQRPRMARELSAITNGL